MAAVTPELPWEQHEHVVCPCERCVRLRIDLVREGKWLKDGFCTQICARCRREELWTLMERIPPKEEGHSAMEVCPSCAAVIG